MIHRITAVLDKDKVFEKILNLTYLLSVEPHAEKDKCFIRFITTTDQFDLIYKKTISEAITSKNATYNVSQSAISKKFYEQNTDDYNKIIDTGNLIFSKNIKKKEKI